MGQRAGQLAREGRDIEAEAVCQEILKLDPSNAQARYSIGLLRLARGDFAGGWPLYEWRLKLPGARGKPRLSFPEWQGQDVGSLLILPEQGLGDMIHFARYVPLLVARGIRVTLGCHPPLARLFAYLGAKVLPMDGEVPIPRHDAWILMGSLPGRFSAIPLEPYLPGRPQGCGIGVSPAGNPSHPGDAERSLFGADAERLLRMGRDLRPEATGARDLEDTAEIIRGLKWVISVDTSVAHLAGAMGKPVTLLIPRKADWRWGLQGDVTPWYPSMRIIRQSTPGDWASVLDQLEAVATT